MASWKKVIVSGSDASLSSVTTSGNISATGSLSVSSSVNFTGLANNAQAYIVGFNQATGQLFYQGTGSFTANSASFATTASYANTSTSASHADAADSAISASFAATASSVNTLNQAVVISGSLSVNTSTGNSFDINADTLIFTGSFNQTGSVYLTGLTQISKSFVVGYDNTTGQLTYQTAVDNADTASFAVSASYAITASYANTSTSASYSATATSASHADAADSAISSSYSATATTASYANTSTSASHADAADSAISSSYALTASYALNVPLTASNANTASYAFYAVSASHAVKADFAEAVTGSSTLSSGSIVLWDGAAFADSSITQDTGVVLIDNPGGVLIQQGGLYVTGSSTFHDNVTVQGNLTVNGTASFQNVTNLAVVDQFILLNSGSSTFQDSGIVINTGNAANSGSAFFLETAGTTTGTNGLYGRFAVAVDVLPDATSATATEYANTTTIVAAAPGNAVPQFGGTGLGQGNTWVDTTNSDIWIYA
jgi:hypothetical protein